jgi:hypothetical protein
MIRNLKEDKRIPLDVRIRAEYMLTEKLKRMVFWNGIKSVKRKDSENTYKAIDILRDWSKTKAFILYTIVKFREYFPPGYYFFVCLNKIRIFFNRTKYKQLQKHFGHYAQFLEL